MVISRFLSKPSVTFEKVEKGKLGLLAFLMLIAEQTNSKLAWSAKIEVFGKYLWEMIAKLVMTDLSFEVISLTSPGWFERTV